jgi:predicted ABC-type transport system involved in lysophospholipase L1 biosynthesis ATPase subunit
VLTEISHTQQRTESPAAHAVDLTKRYGTGDTAVTALAGVSLEFERGRFTAVMGPSGSGKSTLMHCMAGLDAPTSGHAFIGDDEIGRLGDSELTELRRDRIGFVFQAFNLVPTLTAAENITLPVDLAGRAVDRGWFDQLAPQLGIADRLSHRPGSWAADMFRVTVRGLAARKLRLSLTALAIVLGVTFVTGTLVLGDTLNRTFTNLVGTAYQHVSFELRGKAALPGADTAVDSTADRRAIPASIAGAVGRLPGVAYVHGSVGGYAQFLARNDDAIGGGGGSTLGFSFDPNRQLSPYRLVAGGAPTTSDDVVMELVESTSPDVAIIDIRMPPTHTDEGLRAAKVIRER